MVAAWLRLERYREELVRICETIADELSSNRAVREEWDASSRTWRRAYLSESKESSKKESRSIGK